MRGANRNAQGRRSRRGVAATEFALVLPLLLLFAYASVDLSRFAYVYIALSNAARVGAEYGATHQFTSYTRPSWENQVLDAVKAEMSEVPHFDSDQLDIALTTTQGRAGSTEVRVEARYPFETVITWPGVPQIMDLRRQITMPQVR